MRVTDTLGCVDVATTKIRVATLPNFSETAALAADTICFGASTILIGGVTFNDTTGVEPGQGAFINGGVFAGLTYLPDGSGVNYETDIEISQFDTGQVVQNASDIIDICVTMEHSYLGDLEMMLTCPDGSSVILFNSFTGTGIGPEFAGGFGGGGYYHHPGTPDCNPATGGTNTGGGGGSQDPGTGGTGGGGAGAPGHPSNPDLRTGSDATANTGGGVGGGGYNGGGCAGKGISGAGGSGIVIIRYKIQ